MKSKAALVAVASPSSHMLGFHRFLSSGCVDDSLLPGKWGRTKSREGTGDTAAQRAGFQGHFNRRTIVIVGFERNTVLARVPTGMSPSGPVLS